VTEPNDIPDDDPAPGPDLVLGPDEIINYPLRKATRGYQVKEVDDLLDQLAVQTRRLLDRVQRAEQERDALQQEVAETTETESMLKKTLITAQRAAEASVAEAREEAEQLRASSRERAEQLLADAAASANELRAAALRRARADEADIRRYRRDVEEHVEALRTFAEDHRARLQHHLSLQQERLAEMDLPSAPPEPMRDEDRVLDAEVEDVDLDRIMAELSQAAVAAERAEQDDDVQSPPPPPPHRDDAAPDATDAPDDPVEASDDPVDASWGDVPEAPWEVSSKGSERTSPATPDDTFLDEDPEVEVEVETTESLFDR
jgi:cell division septum initiation protein DivIVA